MFPSGIAWDRVAPKGLGIVRGAAIESGCDPHTEAGTASGINFAVARTAGLTAVAGLGLALAATSDVHLDRELMQLGMSPSAIAAVNGVRASLLTGRILPNTVSVNEAPPVAGAIHDAYVAGFRKVMIVSALLATCGASLAAFWNLQSASRDANRRNA